jgi:hypothetical protein
MQDIEICSQHANVLKHEHATIFCWLLDTSMPVSSHCIEAVCLHLYLQPRVLPRAL